MKYITETQIANGIVAIFERLDVIEKSLAILARHHLDTVAPVMTPNPTKSPTQTSAQIEALVRLERLTLKRHAVLTASIGGLNYRQIAENMGCDTTTIKLQLKGAMQSIGVRNREELRLQYAGIIEAIPEEQYRKRFNISKRWWLEDDENLLSLLRQKKAAHNQHVKP